MPRASFLRSSGFKAAAFVVTLFIFASSIAGTAAFLIIQNEVVARHQRAVDQEFQFFADLYRSSGESDLISTLKTHTRTTNAKDTVYLLLGPRAEFIAGNVTIMGSLPASGEIAATTLGLEGDYDYFVRSGPIGPLTLMVGSSAEDLSEIEEVFFQGALWAGLLLVSISLAGGIALSNRMNQRIASVQDALAKIADGRFDVRMPKTGSGDDIDRLGSLVDGAVARLGAAVETNRQITTDIAHDLKTPMNRLRISVENALNLGSKGKSVTRELEEIDRESRQMLATFDALLRVSQIEAGVRRSRFAPVDISDVLRAIGEFYSAYGEELGAELGLKIEPDLPTVMGDRELLNQLFANLIENAFKHADLHPEVLCILALEESHIVARVCDNGPGIPVGERDKVLRRLYRLEKSRTTPGAGLGLSMVKAIADLHGAELRLEDNAPGLSVAVVFPISDDTQC